MKIIKECSQAELDEWTISHWNELKDLINAAIGFLPDCQTVGFDDDKHIVRLLGGTVTIQPEPFEAKSVGGIRFRPGWSVISWKHEIETRTRAGEFVEHQIRQSGNNLETVYFAIEMAFGVILTDWMDRERIDQQAKINEDLDGFSD